jgi:hypothetical protein
MIINKKEDTLMKFGDIDIKIYECKEKYYPGCEMVTFVIGNKKLDLTKILNGGTELKFEIYNPHNSLMDYTLADNKYKKVDQFGFNTENTYLMKISEWYAVDELVKLVKNDTQEPDDSAWVAINKCFGDVDMICVSDKNNHWILEIDPEGGGVSIEQCKCKRSIKTKWPSDKIPVSEDTYELLLPLECVIKTLQANCSAIYDSLEDEITLKTVTK